MNRDSSLDLSFNFQVNFSALNEQLWECLIFRSDRTSRTGVVCVSEVLVENVHWGPLDDSRMGNGDWGLGNGELGMGNGEWGWGMGNGEWGMGNIKLPSWMTVLIKLIDDLTALQTDIF